MTDEPTRNDVDELLDATLLAIWTQALVDDNLTYTILPASWGIEP